MRVSQLLTEISSLQGLATGVKNSSGPFSQFITFDHVYIHRSWGEAIDPLLAEYVTVTNSFIHDCYSVGVYLDNGRHAVFDSNFLLFEDPAFHRSFGAYKAAATGLAMGTEHWYPQLIDVVNVTVRIAAAALTRLLMLLLLLPLPPPPLRLLLVLIVFARR